MEEINQSAMSSTCEDEPTLKRSKTSQEGTVTSHWANLPSLILTEVFSMLNKEDRRNASEVCKNWRNNYFQPRFWRSVKFQIQPNDLDKNRFLSDTFGRTITFAYIVLRSVSSDSLKELIIVMRNLASNSNLNDLVVEYSPSHYYEIHFSTQDSDRNNDLEEVTNLLNTCLPRLTRFTADCMEALSLRVDTILKNLNPELVTKLRLTYMKSFSERNRLDPVLLKRLTKLKVLHIDNLSITDALLDAVESSTGLRKLVLYNRYHLPKHLDASNLSARIPSRRLVQLCRTRCLHSVFYDIQKTNFEQEVIVTRVLLF